MIEALLQEKNGLLFFYTCKGHSQEKRKNGHNSHKDLVLCAALSAIEQQFFFALKDFLGNKLSFERKQSNGFFSIAFREKELQKLSDEELGHFKVITRYFTIGLMMLRKNNQEMFSLHIQSGKREI